MFKDSLEAQHTPDIESNFSKLLVNLIVIEGLDTAQGRLENKVELANIHFGRELGVLVLVVVLGGDVVALGRDDVDHEFHQMVTQLLVDGWKVLALLKRDGSRESGVLITGELVFGEDVTQASVPRVGDHEESTTCNVVVSDLR